VSVWVVTMTTVLFTRFYSVLQLMSLNDANLVTHSSNHLDLAFVSFFEQFRKIYVGDSIQKNSQVCTV